MVRVKNVVVVVMIGFGTPKAVCLATTTPWRAVETIHVVNSHPRVFILM
jgi:hypothetical protein